MACGARCAPRVITGCSSVMSRRARSPSGGSTRTFQTPDGRSVTSGPVQPWTWQIAELFKIETGKIHRIEALLQRSPYGMSSCWSTWTQGRSDHGRDVTME